MQPNAQSQYYDLSIPTTNSIQLKHILKNLPSQSIGTIALDFELKNTITPPTSKDLQCIKMANETKLKVYTRSTLVIEQSANLHQLSNQQSHYDILAVKPLNEKMFHSVCTEYQVVLLLISTQNYDIICFQMNSKMPFMLKRNPVYEAIRKGKYFQIQYEAIFDENIRVICMTNMINIFKATKGKNLIISSHASSTYRHRTPYDVASLMISLGMNKNEVLACMKLNSENVVKSAIHRTFFKGSVKQVTVEQVKKMSKKIAKHRTAIAKIQSLKSKNSPPTEKKKIQIQT